ncbi:MAG TPA: phage/plasmid primase, P4 family [Stellaceae bacterium]|nr:phage/plasmid primase, P4 family [Stellaceae bacterium]
MKAPVELLRDYQPKPDFQAPPTSDEALALTYAERYAGTLRYVAAWARWLKFDGGRWQFEDTLAAFDLARAICREAAAGCNKPGQARKLADARSVAAVERLARSDRRLAARVDQWDADPWLLNTPAGSVDLRSGRLRPHRVEDYLTKATAVVPAGDCPRWLEFLQRITDGDDELELFLQRVAGYCLTGATSEHALFFGHGTGANGKSVFVNTLAGVMGDYATTAAMETFTASKSDRHPTDLAGLRGARLVTATETEEGRRWAEARIKTLTGGDKVSARFMRQDFFEFVPQFKLLIVGNHKPGLRGVDEAIRRRMNLIPFAVTIPEAERDEGLSDKLRAEWPGILRWMVDGCADWQRDGLEKPEAVKRATESYLAAEDALALWLAECCTTKPNDTAMSAALFKSWSRWATAAGEFVSSQKRFSQAIEDRGFIKTPMRAGAQFQGIAIIPEPTPAPYWENDSL